MRPSDEGTVGQERKPDCPIVRRSRCLAVVLFVAAYLSIIGFYFVSHAMGDSGRSPFAYFWTWDMYPGYRTESSRRIVVGETVDGGYVQLVPGPLHRFRWGVNDDHSRFDLDRRLPFLRRATEQALNQYHHNGANPRIQHVYLFEQYWPMRFNLPEDIYQTTYGEPRPQRRYWRLLDEAVVNSDSRPVWTSEDEGDHRTAGQSDDRNRGF